MRNNQTVQRKRSDNYANFNGNHNENCSSKYMPAQWTNEDSKLLKRLEKNSLQNARYKNAVAFQHQQANNNKQA